MGVLHGNGGDQFLTQLIGPVRAAEYLLRVKDVDVKTVEAYGLVNRAYDRAEESRQGVDELAQRIAFFSADTLAAPEASLRANGPSKQSLEDDLNRIATLSTTEEAQSFIRKILTLGGNQSRTPFELGLDTTVAEMFQLLRLATRVSDHDPSKTKTAAQLVVAWVGFLEATSLFLGRFLLHLKI